MPAFRFEASARRNLILLKRCWCAGDGNAGPVEFGQTLGDQMFRHNQTGSEGDPDTSSHETTKLSQKRLLREFLDQVWSAGDLEPIERLVYAGYTIHHDPGDPWDGKRFLVRGSKTG